MAVSSVMMLIDSATILMVKEHKGDFGVQRTFGILVFPRSAVTCGKVAPAFVATLQGLVGAMHYSVGRGLGSLIAGTLFDHLPPRLVYQIVAAASAGCGLIYAILHYLWLRHAPDPKIDIGHSEFTQTAAHTGSGETSKQLDQVHSALLETDHPNQIPASTALFLEESGDEEEEHRKQGRL
ncbi:hypothetical protein BV898_10954 [Hypsibius exemplaris]|uniref:Uncharacterized protein n=1 Tax=Hypsibius exemplaris TaxID=2072580 RepID=A0A1W0WHZ6_HYPEX|nr:hypothetical protein BV898_10954 [Hypsibius exemplaris]